MFDKLESVRDRFMELNETISHPEIIQDFPRYQACLKEISSLEPLVRKYEEYLSAERQLTDAKQLLDDPLMASEAAIEATDLSARMEKLSDELKLLLIPPDPLDSRNVFLEVRSGVGGEEAALFASDLLRMYLRYCDRCGLHTELLSASETDLGGVSEAVVMVSGSDAYAILKYESGTHCVKRVPVTESSGRIHTSTATVAALPEAEEMEVEINPADLRIDVFHASGHGGQGVNTTDSAVRITHLPTGTVVTCQDERSQLENKNKALKVLRSRLYDRMQAENEKQQAAGRRSLIKNGDRSERIRTYYFNHDYVVDHRIGLTVNRTANVLNGDLSAFTEALRLADKTDQLKDS